MEYESRNNACIVDKYKYGSSTIEQGLYKDLLMACKQSMPRAWNNKRFRNCVSLEYDFTRQRVTLICTHKTAMAYVEAEYANDMLKLLQEAKPEIGSLTFRYADSSYLQLVKEVNLDEVVHIAIETNGDTDEIMERTNLDKLFCRSAYIKNDSNHFLAPYRCEISVSASVTAEAGEVALETIPESVLEIDKDPWAN